MNHKLDFDWKHFVVNHDEVYVDIFQNHLFIKRVVLEAKTNSIEVSPVRPNDIFHLHVYPVNGGSIYNDLKIKTSEKSIQEPEAINSITYCKINDHNLSFIDNKIAKNIFNESCLLAFEKSSTELKYIIYSHDNQKLESGFSVDNKILIKNTHKQRSLIVAIGDDQDKLINLKYPKPEINFISLNRYDSDNNYIYFNIEPIYNVIPKKIIIEATDEDGCLIINKESRQVDKLSIAYPKGTRSNLKVRTFDKIGEGLTFYLENYMDY